MEKETMMSDKDLSWFLGVEDETENESTSQEATAVPERERPTNKQETENTMHSESARNTENAAVQRRISAKMRKETLEAYKQAYLLPAKLSNRKAVYLSRETQERADFIVRRLGDRGSNLSSFVENIVRLHLEEYGEDIEKWRKL
ncbi:MAG: DUF3408 domain-containing protein [Prevotella sp.]|uniref:DUF3408 domain-containing protein n=2 Tax=Prevotella TaxID=838 RepID=UPI001C5CE1F9|nr:MULTISPECIES: DUF3408 domain-containing protein [Prevotella]MBF1592276.1 DUF3408 domain-containing protein [Prevotella sp.]MBW4724854.1 DUF3408 domain-containing protein [Prevotella melaninogenica]